MSSLVPYGSYDIDAAKEEYEEASRRGSSSYFKMKVGKSCVRILPPPVGARSPFVKTHQHFLNPPGHASPVVFNCPRSHKAGYDCPVCMKADAFQASNDKTTRDSGFTLRPRRRFHTLILDRDNEGKGVQVWAFGITVMKQLADIRRDADYGGDYTHPFEGMDIIVKREGTKKHDTKYTIMPGGKTCPILPTEEEIVSLLDTAPDLAKQAEVLTAHQIAAKLRGDTPDANDFKDDATDDRPRLPEGKKTIDADVLEFSADDFPDDM